MTLSFVFAYIRDTALYAIQAVRPSVRHTGGSVKKRWS